MATQAEMDARDFASLAAWLVFRHREMQRVRRLSSLAGIGSVKVQRLRDKQGANVRADVWDGTTQVQGMHVGLDLSGNGVRWMAATCKVTFPNTTQMTFVAEIRNHQLTVRRSEG